MPRRQTLGEDHFRTTFNITVEDFGFKDKGDDGRPFHDEMDSNWFDLTIYNGVLDRRDGNFTLRMSWVDLNNQPHKYVLPHAVVKAIVSAHDRIISKSRSVGAKKAHETRVAEGTVSPLFQKKSS